MTLYELMCLIARLLMSSSSVVEVEGPEKDNLRVRVRDAEGNSYTLYCEGD